jgi:hypothetical protein
MRPDAHVVTLQESKLFGLPGRTVIADEPHGRTIRVRHWLTGFASSAALQTYLDVTLKTSAAKILGKRSTLQITGTLDETYAEAVCVSIDPSPDDRGTLPDESLDPVLFHRLIMLVFETLM